PLQTAFYLMLSRNFGQLPVIQGRHLKGVISWEGIAQKLFLGINPSGNVSDFMDETYSVLKSDASLFEAIPNVVIRGYALVEHAGQIVGLITTADLVEHFQSLAEPFLHIGVIEGFLQALLS